MTRRPSLAEIKYLAQRADNAAEQVRLAKVRRLGATVINRRTRAWHIAKAKLEAALAKVEVTAA